MARRTRGRMTDRDRRQRMAARSNKNTTTQRTPQEQAQGPRAVMQRYMQMEGQLSPTVRQFISRLMQRDDDNFSRTGAALDALVETMRSGSQGALTDRESQMMRAAASGLVASAGVPFAIRRARPGVQPQSRTVSQGAFMRPETQQIMSQVMNRPMPFPGVQGGVQPLGQTLRQMGGAAQQIIPGVAYGSMAGLIPGMADLSRRSFQQGTFFPR